MLAPRIPQFAKLSVPSTARILRRPRLFRRLDRARQRRVVWVVAPPGAGKTALLATWLQSRKLRNLWLHLDEADGVPATFFHYLALAADGKVREPDRLPVFTPEFLAAPGGFSRLFFRALCARPRPPAVIVLDDYHEVRPDSPLHGVLSEGLSELPRGVTAIVLSRSEPPAALARFQANGKLEVIRGDELALTRREAGEAARVWGHSEGERDEVLGIHARTEGWAAGMVLLLSRWRSATGKERRDRSGGDQALFDYLAREVLERADPEAQRVLVETALLSSVEGSTAARLTGVDRAEDILAGFASRGCFVVRQGDAYRYHALFREFLLARASRTLSPARRVDLQRSAASLLEQSDQTEEGFLLFVQAGAWDEAVRIIRAKAPLLMREGRAETVARWVGSLPGEVRDHDPWLLFHVGEALSMLDPRAALGHLERGYELFLEADDRPGAYLAWAAIVETHVYALQETAPLDRWISALEDLGAGHAEYGGAEVEGRLVAAAFGALTHRKPWHPALPYWEERALTLALSPGDAHLRMKIGCALLLYYGGWLMDLAKARLVIDTLGTLIQRAETDPSTAIFWHIGAALHHLFLCQEEASLEAVNRGLAVSAATTLHAWDALLLQTRAMAALVKGDADTAEHALHQMAGMQEHASAFGSGAYHHIAFLLAHRRGDVTLARRHAQICRKLTAATGVVLSEQIYGISCTIGGPSDSLEAELQEAVLQARRCRSRMAEALSLLGLAIRALHRRDDQRALPLLRDGFAAARDLGCLHFVLFEYRDLADCYALALEHGIEPVYVRELIRAQKISPGERAMNLESWPWPLRVHALGGLEIERDGLPVEFGKKVPRKALELLRLLVAHGERGAALERLADDLWPDADGDTAQHALETAMYRLRRLLGDQAAIVRRGGRAALDPRRAFVDAWAFEALAGKAETCGVQGNAAEAARTSALAIALYRGDLLPDDERPEIASVRERLRAQAERVVAPSRA